MNSSSNICPCKCSCHQGTGRCTSHRGFSQSGCCDDAKKTWNPVRGCWQPEVEEDERFDFNMPYLRPPRCY